MNNLQLMRQILDADSFEAARDALVAARSLPAIIELSPTDTERLRRWLERPSGSLTTDTDMRHMPRRGLTFEAVEGGGIWVRTSAR